MNTLLSLQFLETFCSKKFKKDIKFDNINPWRRAISGDLTSAFSTFKKDEDRKINFVNRDRFIETLYNAKFTPEPAGYKKITETDLQKGDLSQWMSKQETGTRQSCAIPYELYVNGKLNRDKSNFEIHLEASKQQFGELAAGAPFRVYAIGKHKALKNKNEFEVNRSWNYTVAAGHQLVDTWKLSDFDTGAYHLRVYGPNGFYREFMGDNNGSDIEISCHYQKQKGVTGNIELLLSNKEQKDIDIEIIDNAYGNPMVSHTINAHQRNKSIVLNLKKSSNWYDFTVRRKNSNELQRFAGHVETGGESITDPAMGKKKLYRMDFNELQSYSA
ncbi:phospholipase domain-containing protein [Niabella ginsengisoli]|uniref:DUF756 domain-containing protein n=1 Tax=Niabella ginsengisoli TaxID=522298 RepID=A0ABS9SF49_9BACT|nr:phospholipase domain-containing protein [Niabella ginsengisoli]MCH5596965.1 DUF756 domain-containing protein [Niabella ginsengisoli]